MRRKLVGVAILLALASPGARAQPPALADGLYQVVSSGGVAVKALDGNTVRLGKKLKDPPGSPSLLSRSNDNQQYYLLYGLNKDAPGFAALCAGGFCLSGIRGGENNLEFTSGAAAQAFAKYLGIPLPLRTHPGYALTTRFVPMKAAFSREEPVIVTLEIENVGRVPVTFWVGESGDRDGQFGFTAFGPSGQPVPAAGNAYSFGDVYNTPTLAPGETFRREVDLRKWFMFSLPGVYRITGTYELEFLNPDGHGFPIWSDFAAARLL
jgi:hypothetical protein